jgi:uncharacterized SAM-binding protein YcdF (DUF218 family)
VSLAALPTLLAIPPMNLLAAACAGAAFRRRRAGRLVLAASLAGLVVLSLPVIAGGLTAILESGLADAPAPAEPPQAIVILSGDQQRVRVDGSIAWRVGALTLEREAAGAALARRTGLPVLASGGVIRDGAPSLAAEMDASLRADFAVPPRWLEEKSLDTWQNAQFSAAMLHAAGISRVYVVTHAWHMKRALIAFRHAGLVATPAPVAIDAKPDWHAASFVPSAQAWHESAYALHEFIGWAWYAIWA